MRYILKAIYLIIIVFTITYCKGNVKEPDPVKAEPILKKPNEQLVQAKTRVMIQEHTARGRFHGNKKTKVFHAPKCPDYNCPNCVVGFMTKWQAKRNGYKPHSCVESKKHKRKRRREGRAEP